MAPIRPNPAGMRAPAWAVPTDSACCTLFPAVLGCRLARALSAIECCDSYRRFDMMTRYERPFVGLRVGGGHVAGPKYKAGHVLRSRVSGRLRQSISRRDGGTQSLL